MSLGIAYRGKEMKQRSKAIFIVILLAIGIWAFVSLYPPVKSWVRPNDGNGGGPRDANTYGRAVNCRFEPEPRAVLAEAGVLSSQDPKLAPRASGAIYMLAVYEAEDRSQLGLFISHDGGDTFAPPVPIGRKGADVNSHGENSPSLALGTTEVYALWEQSSPEGGMNLMFARSLSFGRKFEKSILLNEASGSSFPYLAAAPNGHLYAVWLEGSDRQSDPPWTSTVYLLKSTDRGATFGKKIRVAASACPCCRPSLAFGNKGEVFVAWRKVFDGNIRDMVVSASYDRGEKFGPPVRVAEDNWEVQGCPHSGPTMVRKGSRLYIAWHTKGDNGNAVIRLSWSDDDAKTFAPPVLASGNILDANRPSLSISDNGRVMLVFQGRDPVKKEGWSPTGAYLVEIGEAGDVSQPMPVPGNRKAISYPVVAAGHLGQVFIAWTEPGPKSSNIILSRGRITH